MPLQQGTKYRFKKLSGGRKQRLAFHGGKVVEVMNYMKNGKKGETVMTSGAKKDMMR